MVSHSCSSASTPSVTRLIRSGDTCTSYISRRCAWMSRVVNPRAYSATIRSLNPSSLVWPFRTIFGSKLPAPVSGHLQIDRADVGEQLLRSGPVPAVPRTTTSWIVLLIAQMRGQLLTQRPFEYGLGDLAE